MPRETLVLAGIALVFLGIITVIAGSFLGDEENATVEIGVGGFIGPVPFGFATDKKLLYTVLALSVILAAAWWVAQP